MKELNDIEALIIRSLDKTATKDDLSDLKQWINQSGVNKKLYFEFKDVWDATGEADIPSKHSAWRSTQSQLSSGRSMPKWVVEVVKIAAITILVALVSYTIFKLPEVKHTQSSLVTISVPKGSQSTVELADGSIIKLNAGSELSYPSVFNKEERQVYLSGEGYFSVYHDSEHPFIVSAGEIEVRVLGTEFNVMAYEESGKIETTLLEGSVSLNKKGGDHTNGIILKPGQKAIYANGKMAVNPANLEMETDWVNKGFYFQNTSFETLVTRLERWYDVDIVIQSEAVKDLSFTGKFRNNETIWQVLDVIKMTTPIDYKTINNKIYITLISE